MCEILGRSGEQTAFDWVASSFRAAGWERNKQSEKKSLIRSSANKLMPDCEAGHESSGRCTVRFFFLCPRCCWRGLALWPNVDLCWKCPKRSSLPTCPGGFAIECGLRGTPTDCGIPGGYTPYLLHFSWAKCGISGGWVFICGSSRGYSALIVRA